MSTGREPFCAWTFEINESEEGADGIAPRKTRMEQLCAIRSNAHKYSVSAMCSVLQIPKNTYYYEQKPASHPNEQKLEDAVIEIFCNSRKRTPVEARREPAEKLSSFVLNVNR